MQFVYATGGREKYYDSIKVGDCVDAWSGAPVGHRRSVC